jgi:hypothetical protein
MRCRQAWRLVRRTIVKSFGISSRFLATTFGKSKCAACPHFCTRARARSCEHFEHDDEHRFTEQDHDILESKLGLQNQPLLAAYTRLMKAGIIWPRKSIDF